MTHLPFPSLLISELPRYLPRDSSFSWALAGILILVRGFTCNLHVDFECALWLRLPRSSSWLEACAANFCPALLGTIFSLPLGNLFHFLTYVSIKEMLAFLLGKISSFRLTTSFHQWQKEKRWKCSFVVNEATLPLTDPCYNRVRSYTALPIGHNAFLKIY